MTNAKRRSRYDPPEADEAPAPTTAAVLPWESPAETAEAHRLLEAARADVERIVQDQMRKLESILATKTDHLAAKLHETRAEIERLEKETAAMRANRYDDVLAKLRSQMDAL